MSRILVINYSSRQQGGIEVYNRDVIQTLRHLGHAVTVVSIFDSGTSCLSGALVYGLCPTDLLSKRIYMRVWPLFLTLWLQTKISEVDLVIIGHVNLLSSVCAYTKRIGAPSWLLAYGIEVWQKQSQSKIALIDKCECIVTISRFTAERIQEYSPQAALKTYIIPPTVDTDRFRPSDSINADTPTKTILTVARLSASERYKGQDLILGALSTIRDLLYTGLLYRVVGDGDDRARLIELARQYKVSDIVEFCGQVDDNALLRFYQECTIFAMPSYVTLRSDGSWTGEGFGIAYAEASACAKPILACSVGGQTDIVVNGVTGVLVEPNVLSVSEGLLSLLQDPQRSIELGNAGRLRVVNSFSRLAFGENWQRLLNAARY